MEVLGAVDLLFTSPEMSYSKWPHNINLTTSKAESHVRFLKNIKLHSNILWFLHPLAAWAQCLHSRLPLAYIICQGLYI